MEVVGQIFGSLVKENDRVTLVDGIYAVFNFLLILYSLLCGYYKKLFFLRFSGVDPENSERGAVVGNLPATVRSH